MREKERVRLYTHPSFKKKLKLIAVEKGIPLQELTREMGEIDLNIFEDILARRRKKNGFKFKL